jgi:cytochrome c-type biogenesis protein CcmH
MARGLYPAVARAARWLAIGCIALAPVVAQPQPVDVTQTPAESALTMRLKRLETELRCLVCQNQTLADSSAPLAEDLRREVRQLAVAGKSDDEIRTYLTSRYGDFVLYNPPVQRTTWLLWFGPLALLAAGALAWWWVARRRVDGAAPVADDADAQRRGRALLDAD